MDPLTHGVASLALQRAFWPKAKGIAIISMLVAGILPDIDWFATIFGPSFYLGWHRVASHSLLGTVLLSAAAVLLALLATVCVNITLGSGFVIPVVEYSNRSRSYVHFVPLLFFFVYIPALLSGLLHLMMDWCQSDYVGLLWPFSARRFALDLLPYLEPWLLALLLLAILLPELFRLIGDEIGSRSKVPRGRNGAIAGLICAVLYIGARALLHENALASLNAHTIAGEMPRRCAAFPDSTSLFLWHSVVETQSTLNLVTLRSVGGEVSQASGIMTLHKPEPSPILNTALNSPAALAFLQAARFPKATVETETEGYSVEIQDLKDQATEEKTRAILADINLDKNGKVVSSELQWQKGVSNPR